MDGYIIPGRFFQNGCFVSVLPREAYKVEGMLVLYWINFRYFCRSTKNVTVVKKSIRFIAMAFLLASVLTSCKNKNADNGSNPFFSGYDTPFNVPPFGDIKPEHYMPAFERGIIEGKKDLLAITSNPETATFENTIVAYDRMGELLGKVSRVFFEVAGSNTNEDIRKIELEVSPMLAEYYDEILLNPELFSRIKSVYDNRENAELTGEQLYILENIYKSFVRNGANLSEEDQGKLKEINQRLSVLTVQFEQNVLMETNDYMMFVGESDLEGLPESVISMAAAAAKDAGQEGKWAFTTQRPSIFPFMRYSPNRELRKQIYGAYINRGNNGNEQDNNLIFAEVVKLRAERAKLLGYDSHADLILDSRMAKTPANVYELLDNLWERSLIVAQREVDEMQEIIDKEGGNFDLEEYDWWYYAEKLRKQKYDLDDSELRPYFKLENVQAGLFETVNRLFGITLTEIAEIPKPHPDAVAYEVKEADGSHLGVVYFDFFPRESKGQGAWCSTYESRYIDDGKIIPPIVSTVYNFTKPSGDMPSLLTLDEVRTLFHEFGHALDALMNENSYHSTFIPWDFVELPSQILEHWATEPEVLKLYAKHYETGEVIPDELIGKIDISRFFNQGFDNTELLAASLLDMAYHTLEAPVNIEVQEFEKNYLKEIGLIPEIEPRYRTTYFLHIIGGYDAGYYCYTWAAVLDNDAFEAFREHGIFDKATADSYRKNILAKNGIMDASAQYLNFRGRDPELEPLLRNRGLN